MITNKIARAQNWAEKHGLKTAVFVRTSNDATLAGLLIYTDYTGAYPPASVYDLHTRIAQYARRAGLKYEPGAMHTGARLYA